MSRPSKPRFFKPAAAKKSANSGVQQQRTVEVTIERLSDEGRGIGFIDGKPLFIAGALPGEKVSARITDQRRDHADAQLLAVTVASNIRIEPRCSLFGRCGGCQLQMLDYTGQLHHKQQVLRRLLDRFNPQWETPIVADPWHYRHRARFAVGEEGGKPAIGFKGAASHRLVAATRCDIIDPRLQPLLQLLPAWLEQLKQWRRIEEIIAIVDADGRIAIDWQGKGALPAADRELLQRLCSENGVATGSDVALRYAMPASDSHFHFSPRDFTQVNPAINDQLAVHALTWLAPTPASRAIDLFCGLGNFTLPLAKRTAQVTGVEGSATMVERARLNAADLGLQNARFIAADLFEPDAVALQGYDLALLDPPRAGARALCESLKKARNLQRIVYVSCNPQTLARDVAILASGGFTVERAALVDMFPQSGHSEAIVLLSRQFSRQ